MINLQNISYSHPDKEILFDNIDLIVNEHEKVALIGKNGSGKTTLLKIIAKVLHPSGGNLNVQASLYYLPQIYGQFNHMTVGQALAVEDKFKALKEILGGNVTERNLIILNEDWEIEEKCRHALEYWQLSELNLNQKLSELSGGQKTKVFLAGISIHEPKIVLLDEPSNHLDTEGRRLLYEYIKTSSNTMLIVSHDRKLLNLLNYVCELNKDGIEVFGGNYDFYAEQKQLAHNALVNDIRNKEKALRKAKEKERETIERKQKLDARGKKKQVKAGTPKTMINKMKNDSEKSSSKLKGIHNEKISNMSAELTELRTKRPDIDQMKFGFDNSELHTGKILIKANGVNVSYDVEPLWKENLTFKILSGERLRINGLNGSGKTSLIKLIMGNLKPLRGDFYKADSKGIYIDQDYSLIENDLSIYEQAQKFNDHALLEHEIKIRLHRFLFDKEVWRKPCTALSGGEKMRLMLCCLTIGSQAPDMIILDEPTNNLDIQNMDILTAAINEYKGTLIVVSHDEYFLEQIHIQRSINL